MNHAPHTIDPHQSMFAESLGHAPGRGRLVGRRVIVVGAGQRPTPEGEGVPVGNGRAIAMLAAREGAHVACVDVSPESVQTTVAEIAASGSGQAFADVADVHSPEQITALMASCTDRLGGLDGLVLNVGISHGLPMHKLTPESWDDEFAVNLRSHMLLCQAALPLMAPGGSIVLMSSLAALRNQSRNPAYEASKAGQVSLARSVAVAGESKAIRCNALLPGLIDTPMGRDATRHRPNRAAAVPFGRQGTGWEVAYACIFLLSHEASYVNATALLVDGGLGVGVARSVPLSPT